MRFTLLLVLALLAIPSALLAGSWGEPGPMEVATSVGVWTDAARGNREVPYRIYQPAKADTPCPIVIISHGLGGNRDTYKYLGEHFASHGYLVIHLQHHGSDTDMLREAVARGEDVPQAMRKSAMDLRNAIDRPRDVSFAIDQLEKANASGDLKGKLDLAHIAIAGHSFGGYTAMAIAGQTGGRMSFRDKRVSAAIGMSAPSPKLRATYSQVDIPVLLMTGTLDDSPLEGGTAQQRIDAFQQLKLADRYLVVFNGGDHMIFSGAAQALGQFRLPGMAGDRAKDPAFQAKIRELSEAFLDGYLRGDQEALRWLASDKGAKADLGDLAATWRAETAAR